MSYNFHKKLTAQICGQEVKEELVHHKHYNSGLQADSYAHMANVRERQNWMIARLHYALRQWMAELAYRVEQMTASVVGLVWVIEDSPVEALQKLSKHH